MFFPQVWESTSYKTKLVYLDVDGNGRCDPTTEPVFGDARGTPDTVLVVRDLDASATPGRTDFAVSGSPEADCAVLNSVWPET